MEKFLLLQVMQVLRGWKVTGEADSNFQDAQTEELT